MISMILEDAKRRPDLFNWNGPIDPTKLHAWLTGRGIRIHPQLASLLEMTGGGEMFESETILSPFDGHATGDNAEEANEFHRQKGLPPELWLFHVGMVLSAVDQRTGSIVVLSREYRHEEEEYATLDAWYREVIREEYAGRYGLHALDPA